MRVADLFAGCGGLSLGFQEAGYDVVVAYDAWEPAINCYRANFKHPVVQMDLSAVEDAIKSISHFNPDIIVGGPPCQDFSHAGRRSEGARASLSVTFAEIVKGIHPNWFVFENVDRSRNSLAYAAARKIFKEADYGLTEVVLNASRCGVPQSRKRFICIGCSGESDGFMDWTIASRMSDKPMTIRDYLGDKLGIEHYYRHPRNYNRRGVFSIDEPSPTIRGVNRPVPSGYLGHHNDPVEVSDDLRPLSTYERALIQTFPESYKWLGTKTDMEQMIGNAVPVKLAYFVAQAIMAYTNVGSGVYCGRKAVY